MKPYPTDLTDDQWENLSQYLPERTGRGRQLKWDLRLIINAILYVVVTGCQWRMLPHEFPPWQTVYYHFRKWQKHETWFVIHQALHQDVRKQEGRDPEPNVINLSYILIFSNVCRFTFFEFFRFSENIFSQIATILAN